jgi:hypothetical protein
MRIFKKIKRFWELSNKDEDVIEEFMKLSDKQIMEMPDEDSKAVFMGLGSEDEFIEEQNIKKFGVKKLFDI